MAGHLGPVRSLTVPAPLVPVRPPDPAPQPEPVPPAPRRTARRVLVVGGVVLALVLTAVVAFRWGSAGRPAAPAARPSPSPSAGPLSVAQVHAAVFPSVVAITTPTGAGTGVIANADGTILTALHVVQGQTVIEVTFADGTRSPAKVIGSNPAIDIAALTPASLPALVVPAILGGSMAIGDEVVAIGNQLGLADSTTAGVVSGLNRSAGDLRGLIQFDAAVNPGSSGGPLANNRGQIVGIVVALANPTGAGTFIGIGFAVPIGAALGPGTTGDGPQPQR